MHFFRHYFIQPVFFSGKENPQLNPVFSPLDTSLSSCWWLRVAGMFLKTSPAKYTEIFRANGFYYDWFFSVWPSGLHMSLLKSWGRTWRWLFRNILNIKKPSVVFKPVRLLTNGLTLDYYSHPYSLACVDGLESVSTIWNTSETALGTQLCSCMEGKQLEGVCAQCWSLELQGASPVPQKMISFALKLKELSMRYWSSFIIPETIILN